MHARMSEISCPQCSLTDIASAAEHDECLTCGHEWPRVDTVVSGPRVVKDANGNVIVSGDDVVLIKELKLKGSGALKGGTKVRNIKIVDDGDHEIDCKVDGMGIMLKAMYVRKA